MSEFVLDKRKNKHCPVCLSTHIEIILDPLPTSNNFQYGCVVCGHKIDAKREEDKHEFKKQAVVFTQ